MFWDRKIESKIDDVGSLCYDLRSDIQEIKDGVKNKLSAKEYSILDSANLINKLRSECDDLKVRAESYKSEAEKHYEDTETISELQKVIEGYKEQLSDYEILKKQKELLTKQVEQLQTSLKLIEPIMKSQNDAIDSLENQRNILQDDVTELRQCFSAVLRGMYDREEIEFAALKTYRGWKYIYSNGVTTEDFSNTNNVEISWNNGESVKLSMNN